MASTVFTHAPDQAVPGTPVRAPESPASARPSGAHATGHLSHAREAGVAPPQCGVGPLAIEGEIVTGGIEVGVVERAKTRIETSTSAVPPWRRLLMQC